MKRICLIAAVFLLSMQAVMAQSPYRVDTARGFDPSKLMVGGNFGFAFGNYSLVNVSPMIGYRFSPKAAAGISINAQFTWEKYREGSYEVKNNYTILGGGIWGRYYPLEMLFVHAQPEYNSISYKKQIYSDPRQSFKERYGAPSLLLGGGYAQPIGGNSALVIMLLYDVLQDENSPYRNRPVFSVGGNFGF
ncbi:hypothetical protein WJU16_17680 [Chitinophaga pollutisoli]|uniref:Outer membrane protein beta-barrel domain-containing protein n=1 Tax=Chitinophaga pollutisoli TaxID=3133966 RepID=A0ABZ2YJC1_9BACT